MKCSLNHTASILAALCVLAVLAGCRKEAVVTRASVSFSVVPDVSGETKAALSADGESRIGSLDLLMFSSGVGILDTHVRVDASGTESLTSLEASVTRGVELRWYIVANAPAGLLSACELEEQFLGAVTTLEDMSGDVMVMHAGGVNVFGDEVNRIDGVLLVRYACKVTLQSLRVSWLGTFDVPPSCTLDKVALVNVRGDGRYSGVLSAAEDDLWYNRSSIDAHSPFIDRCILWEGSLPISGPESVDVGISLYAMPNPSEGDGVGPVISSNPWTPRRTRLVLGLTIEDIFQWYPVDLPAMVEKTHYVAENVIIMGPGTPGPDEGIDRTSIDFTVNVYGWGEYDHGEYVFPTVESMEPEAP